MIQDTAVFCIPTRSTALLFGLIIWPVGSELPFPTLAGALSPSAPLTKPEAIAKRVSVQSRLPPVKDSQVEDAVKTSGWKAAANLR